jgi:hypothetical protein
MHRYQMVRNNPLAYIDRDGFEAVPLSSSNCSVVINACLTEQSIINIMNQNSSVNIPQYDPIMSQLYPTTHSVTSSVNYYDDGFTVQTQITHAEAPYTSSSTNSCREQSYGTSGYSIVFDQAYGTDACGMGGYAMTQTNGVVTQSGGFLYANQGGMNFLGVSSASEYFQQRQDQVFENLAEATIVVKTERTRRQQELEQKIAETNANKLYNSPIAKLNRFLDSAIETEMFIGDILTFGMFSDAFERAGAAGDLMHDEDVNFYTAGNTLYQVLFGTVEAGGGAFLTGAMLGEIKILVTSPFIANQRIQQEINMLEKGAERETVMIEGVIEKEATVVGNGFKNFTQLKKSLGSPGQGNQWHHIVEQSQISKSSFSTIQINNTNNIIAIDQATHAKISGFYNSTYPGTNMRVRDWLAGQSFEAQYDFGIQVLRNFGILN